MDEYELKFLDIDVKKIKNKLESLGAVLKYDSNTESYSFLADGFHGSDSSKKFLRVRKLNGEVFITYKAPVKSGIREEVELKVDDYDSAIKLLERLGFKKCNLFRKHRLHYELNNVHFELDTLDNVPTYLEIETSDEKEMIFICDKLGLDIKNGKKGTIVEILPEKFK